MSDFPREAGLNPNSGVWSQPQRRPGGYAGAVAGQTNYDASFPRGQNGGFGDMGTHAPLGYGTQPTAFTRFDPYSSSLSSAATSNAAMAFSPSSRDYPPLSSALGGGEFSFNPAIQHPSFSAPRASIGDKRFNGGHGGGGGGGHGGGGGGGGHGSRIQSPRSSMSSESSAIPSSIAPGATAPWEFDLQGPHVRANSSVRTGSSASAQCVSTVQSIAKDMDAFAARNGHDITFKVVTWNALAEELDKPSDFPRTPPFCLDFWNFRLPFIIDILNAINADVICMQEVNHPEYLAMQVPGYRMIFVGKLDSPCSPNAPPDGCVLMVKVDSFEILHIENVYYQQAQIVPRTSRPVHSPAPFAPSNGGAKVDAPFDPASASGVKTWSTSTQNRAAADGSEPDPAPTPAEADGVIREDEGKANGKLPPDGKAPPIVRAPGIPRENTSEEIRIDSEAPLMNQNGIIVRLRCKKTRKQIIVATTHLKAKSENSHIRLSQIKQMLARVKKLSALPSSNKKFGIPVILCGDMNSDPTDRVVFEQVYCDRHLSFSSCFNSFTQMQEIGRVVHFHDDTSTKANVDFVRPLGPMKRQLFDSYASSEPAYSTWKLRGVGQEVLTKKHCIDYMFATLSSDYVPEPDSPGSPTVAVESVALPTSASPESHKEDKDNDTPPCSSVGSSVRALRLVNCHPLLGPDITGFRGLPSSGFPSDHLFLCSEFAFL